MTTEKQYFKNETKNSEQSTLKDEINFLTHHLKTRDTKQQKVEETELILKNLTEQLHFTTLEEPHLYKLI